MGSVIGTAVYGVGSLVGNVISSPFNGAACEYVRLKTTKSGVSLRRLPLRARYIPKLFFSLGTTDLVLLCFLAKARLLGDMGHALLHRVPLHQKVTQFLLGCHTRPRR
jgi:hypothetical protein